VRLFGRRQPTPGSAAGPREASQSRFWLIVVALALILAYLVAFVAENSKSVTVRFVFFSGHTSVIWLILLSLAIGIVAGLLLSQLERRRRGHKRG
jgi:uncharacterized integral membrane protein